MTLRKPLILIAALAATLAFAGCTMPTGAEKFEHKGCPIPGKEPHQNCPVSDYELMLRTTPEAGASDAVVMKVLANRRVAAEALGQLGSAKEHADMLAAVAEDTSQDLVLRIRSTWALGMLKAEKYNGLLIGLLKEGLAASANGDSEDPHWAIREAAVFGLGRIGLYESRAPLEELQQVEKVSMVQTSIKTALDQLSPVDYIVFPSDDANQAITFKKVDVGVDPDPLSNNLALLIDYLERRYSVEELWVTIYERSAAAATATPQPQFDPAGDGDQTSITPAEGSSGTGDFAVDGPEQPEPMSITPAGDGAGQWIKGEKVAWHHSWSLRKGRARGMESEILGSPFNLESWRKQQGKATAQRGPNFMLMLLMFLVFTYFWTNRLAKQAQGGGKAAK